MKNFQRIFAIVFMVMILILLIENIVILNLEKSENGRPYRVEISRLALEIKEKGFDKISLSEYQYVTNITGFESDFYNSESDYIIREIDGKLYRFDYLYQQKINKKKLIISVNLIMLFMLCLVVFMMLFVQYKIIQPFEQLIDVPYQLSKGNLAIPLKESKSKFFGKFIWGIDLLREHMEQQKLRELDLQREKKMLLLSLSHDIKTPLSAIKLYAKALSKGIYADKKKQDEIAENINKKADEIESYVSKIIIASREDFLTLPVNLDCFYLSELIKSIQDYYSEKLAFIRTNFNIKKYFDCLIKGDLDRSVEVLQNIIENAIKYGDGNNIEIDFAQEEEENSILILIKNSGCSLQEHELSYIFESFQRGQNTENIQGSGLGLYICKQIMHKMGGEIFAEIEGKFMIVTTVFEKA